MGQCNGRNGKLYEPYQICGWTNSRWTVDDVCEFEYIYDTLKTKNVTI